MKQIITVGNAGPIDEGLFLQDSTSSSGAGLTGLAYNTSGLTCYYKRNNGTASAAVSLATIATLGTYATGGFKEIDATNMPGMYEFHPPTAAFASGATSVTFYFQGAANLVPRPIQYEISAVNLQDGTRGGLTALPNVASGSAGGVIVQGTGTTGLNVSSGVAQASLAAILGTALTESVGGYLAAAFKKLFNVASPTFTMDSTGSTLTAVPDTSGTTTLLSRLTSARAGYLDNLNVGGAVASHADILNFTQSMPNAMLVTTAIYWQQATTQTYPVYLYLWNAAGQLTDADGGVSGITNTVTNGAGTDRSSNFSGWTHATTGVYTATYSVTSSTALEPLIMKFTGTVSSAAFVAVSQPTVTTEATVSFNSTDRSNLTAVYNKLPTNNIADETLLLDAIGTPMQAGNVTVGGYATNEDPAYLLTASFAAVATSSQASTIISQTSASTIESDVQAALTSQGYTTTRAGYLDTLNGLVAAVWGAATSGLTATGSIGKAILAFFNNLTYTVAPTVTQIDTQLSGTHGSGQWGSSAGAGGTAYTLTVESSGTPLANVACWVSTDSAGATVVAGTLYTDGSGQVTFMLASGTYYLWRTCPGYNFPNPVSFTV